MGPHKVAVLLSCLAIPVSGHAQFQAGWSEHELESFAAGCTEAIVTPAKEDFAKAAAKAGDDKAAFPEKEIRSSVKAMCTCLAQRIATTLPLREPEFKFDAYLSSLIEEAFAGGRCKPEGKLSEVLDRAKRKRVQ